MNTKKITSSILSLSTTAALIATISVASVQAQTVNTSISATAHASTTKAHGVANESRLSTIISRSDAAITARITALNNLSTRINGLKNVSANQKTAIANEVQTNTTGLTTLKAKIDADTDVTTALSDEKTITGSFRIYALVIPQGYIESAADRVDTVGDLMTTISGKLQTRISAGQTAGKDVTALQTSLTDLYAKIADAKSQAGIAVNGVATLTPDGGNKTTLAANTAALKTARASIKTATGDLETARKDAKSIIEGLKSLNIKATATTTIQ